MDSPITPNKFIATRRYWSWRARFGLAALPTIWGLLLLLNAAFVWTTDGLDQFVVAALIASVGLGALAARCFRVRLDLSPTQVEAVNVWSTRNTPTTQISRVEIGLIAFTWSMFPIQGLWIIVDGGGSMRPKRLRVSTCRGRRSVQIAVAAFERLGVPSVQVGGSQGTSSDLDKIERRGRRASGFGSAS